MHRMTSVTTEDNPLWLIVLSDIMTNLMLFFLIMYVFNQQSEDSRTNFYQGFQSKSMQGKLKEKKADEIIQKFIEKDTAQTIMEAVQKPELKNMAQVQVTDKQIRVNLSSPVLFKSGRANLAEDAMTALDSLGKALAPLKTEIIVEGHTDNIRVGHARYRTNWELSAGRANAVIDYLSAKFLMPQEQFLAAAYGEFRPIADNSTASGRAKNRRIEIIVLRQGGEAINLRTEGNRETGEKKLDSGAASVASRK